MGGPGSGRKKGSGGGKRVATKSKGLAQKQTKEERKMDKERGYRAMAGVKGKR
jgi:hypothetical protein